MTNKLNWSNIETRDDRKLYLKIMKDLRAYAAKGYIDIEMSLMNLMIFPNSLVSRIWNKEVEDIENNAVIYLDWEKLPEVHSAMYKYIKLLCKINHVFLNKEAFDLSFDEFANYLSNK